VRLAVGALVLLACGDGGAGAPDAAPAPDAGADYPPPRTDVVPRVGTDGALDVATWNVENFPRTPVTAERMADLIASLDLDLVAMQEIEDVAAFEELVARLPAHEGVLSPHTYGDGTYQKLAFVYRADVLAVSDARLLLTSYGYDLPRPPLQVTVAVTGADLELTAIAVHLKAGFAAEDRARREAAVALLEDEVAAGADPDAVVLGDFNEVLTTADGRAVMAPWLDAPARYSVLTEALATAGTTSFLPSGAMLDHAVATASLSDELAGGATVVPRLNEQYVGYTDTVSDHLPVVVSMPVLGP
jgi:endonuclease/exonuclease/phosphatase family metal-dependent hydrolase